MKDKLKPLVSVLIPVYNAENYISSTIESVLAQSYKNLEILICDDASTDQTYDLLQKYVSRDRRIKLFRNSKNLYIAANRNKLVKLATGKYIAWQDADDISLPNRLQLQVDILEADESIGIVGGGMVFFNDIEGETSVRLFEQEDSFLRKKIFMYSPVAQPTAMIRKEAFKKTGPYDLSMPPSEDLDMSFRIGMYYKFANVRDVVVRYREHPNSATYTRLRKIEANTIKIRFKYAKSGYYSMTFIDKIYNYAQWLTIYIVPAKLKIKLFNRLRNTGKDENHTTH